MKFPAILVVIGARGVELEEVLVWFASGYIKECMIYNIFDHFAIRV